MANRQRVHEPASGSTVAYRPVYVNTNFDTHFAILVSDFDIMSDIKQKIVFEHGRFFPEIGEIKVDALKVKHRENFYYLPDYMSLEMAFGNENTWFLYVDISKCNGLLQSLEHDASNQRALLMNTDSQVHAQGHFHGDSSNIPPSTQETKEVNNQASDSSTQSEESCSSVKKMKRKNNLATSASKDNTTSFSQELHSTSSNSF